VTALPAVVGAVDSVQTRQSSAERDLLAQEQEHRNREASATGPAVTETAAAAAEAAVIASCEVAQQVLQQLQCLEASTVVGLMVNDIPYCTYSISDCSKLLLLYIHTVQQLLPGLWLYGLATVICPGLHAEPILVNNVKHCQNQPCTHCWSVAEYSGSDRATAQEGPVTS